MENLVVTFETAQELELAEWPTDPDFCWASYAEGDGELLWQVEPYHGQDHVIRAPTVSEILEQLPAGSCVTKHTDGYSAELFVPDELKAWHYEGDTAPETLAALWLRLKEVQS
jgi:hypothetical protein